MNKNRWVTVGIIFAVIILSYFALTPSKEITPTEITQCIGENSVLYIQLGCHACETQENLFGDNYNDLTIVDCFFDIEKCQEAEITATPTWVINQEKIIGVQSIKKLQELTGC
ncbi:hypothetical protein HN832_01440 [archaeon]|jgi:hypothetical protein|nr:hypothetical protein [archaeon]MBT4373953.1 hypothetical protein [archaeon]MBT4532346.1 hypothetical protein [archaeon]MBT7001932.1 hypothetical protein [archaeon]MBT7282055.1 hypothetical protein [archaeon]